MPANQIELNNVQIFLVNDAGCTMLPVRWHHGRLWDCGRRVPKDAFIHICKTLFSGAEDVPIAIKFLRERGYVNAGWHGELCGIEPSAAS